MIEAVRAVLVLLIPWLAGIQLCRLLLPARAGWALVLGAGYFVGFALAVFLLWLQDALAGGIGAIGPLCILIITTAIAWMLAGRVRRDAPSALPARFELLPTVIILLCGILVVPVVIDVWLRPLFPWDAWYTYALQAKVYTHLGELVEFVNQYQWRDHPTEGVFNTYVAHGQFVPLIQTWMGIGIGRWSESLVNLPWPGAWLAIALLIGGSARMQGLKPAPAALAGAAVIALPMAGVHAVLAGYAELWMAGFAILLVISLISASSGRTHLGWLLIAVIAAIAVFWLKRYGLILVGIIVLTALLSMVGQRYQWRVLGLTAATAAAMLWYLAMGAPFDLSISLGGLGEIGFRDAEFKAPGIPNITIQERDVGVGLLLASLLFSQSFLLMTWLSLSFLTASAYRFPDNISTRFAVYWFVIIVFGAWGATSYTGASSSLGAGVVHNRFLMVVILITYAVTLIGAYSSYSNRCAAVDSA